MKSSPRKPVTRIVRTIVALAVLLLAIVGIAAKTDLGTLCAWCPLGFAQASLASREVYGAIVFPLIVVALAALLFGRAFCSWVCPSGLVKKKSPRYKMQATRPIQRSSTVSSLVLVAGVLAASFIVGFPLFCLFCPIGLVFGFVYAAFRTLTIYQPSWDLVIFPALLLIELRLFGSWCTKLCPLGAAASLVARVSPFRLRMKADRLSCNVDASCRACEQVCPEHFSASAITSGSEESCTLCLECKDACPSRALSPALPRSPKAKEDPPNE
ncbi:4Fe-4S binding protein [Raoultibacter phocaeensis]|uniref:4Fe-4S binding protein n=1 Tax=Raoultibacter phocaeensis TaxID=2479841 RepID=UPI0015D62314|nr:4Fe-4S binding protein [Raoultibacter phocaeensis]